MAETHHTTTHIGGGEGVELHFSGEVPAYTLPYAPAPEIAHDQAKIIQLEEDLGRVTIQAASLEGENRELQDRVKILEARLSDFVEVEPVAPELEPITSELEPATPAPEQLKKPLEIDMTPDPALSPADQRYELLSLDLLQQPGQSLRRPNVSRYITEKFGWKMSDWSNARVQLEKLKIIEIAKSSPRIIDGVDLNLDSLRKAAKRPFVTERVLTVLASVSDEHAPEASLVHIGGNGGPPSPALKHPEAQLL